MTSTSKSTVARREAVSRELGLATDLAANIDAYIDVLDAALLDGHLASFECAQLQVIAQTHDLNPGRLEHIHFGYFIALAVEAWADGEISVVDEMRLTMIAVALAIPTAEAIQMVVTARDIEPPVELSVLGLAPRDRVTFVDPLGTCVDDWSARATSVGLVVSADRGAARYVVTADPDHRRHRRWWNQGAIIITEWAFEAALEQLELRRRRRGLEL